LGPKITPKLAAQLVFDEIAYRFELEPTADNGFVLSHEAISYKGNSRGFDSRHPEAATDRGPAWHSYLGMANKWVVYHFHDTSEFAGVRRDTETRLNRTLAHDASNLPAFLYGLRESYPRAYREIRDVVRLAAPFLDDFNLEPLLNDPNRIRLEWRQTDSDYVFGPHALSDGTLRFICLATALLQPYPPDTMLFDEPELGLHPHALVLLGDLMRQQSKRCPLIVSTQSAALLSEFAPEDVVVVERVDGQSEFRRLDASSLSEWLDDYSLGDLWQKNLLGGQPRREVAEVRK
jgi:predicted ATPase